MKKGLLSNSLPKTFSFIFSHIGLALYYYRAFFILGEPYMRKNQLKKSLERGMGESLSSERFPPIINYKLLYEYCGYVGAFYLYFGKKNRKMANIVLTFKNSYDIILTTLSI